MGEVDLTDMLISLYGTGILRVETEVNYWYHTLYT